eukprot:GHVP01069774.1.p1 GENE.GHVP01069774.1~~GHVP01069774.1.p1  ORF type:complete len:317 (-),score=46.83 GHVP01069774.1:855-1805(-)
MQRAPSSPSAQDEKEIGCWKSHQTCGLEELTAALKDLKINSSDVFEDLIRKVKNDNPQDVLAGVKGLRLLLSAPGHIPIEEVINSGVISILVTCLMCSNSVLQFESGWALTNIASGTSSQTQAVVEVGGVLGFLNLLRSRESPLQEQGLWGIGNVAGDRLEYRDLLLDSDVCVSLIVSIFQDLLLGKNFPNDTNVLRTAVFCVSNLCRGKPRPKFDRTSPFLPFLAQILDLETADEALLADVLWALEGMTESTKSIDLLIEHCVPQKASCFEISWSGCHWNRMSNEHSHPEWSLTCFEETPTKQEEECQKGFMLDH